MNDTVILVPTYNEIGNLERFLDAIRSQNLPVDILIIDDNSPDGTAAKAEDLSIFHTNLRVLKRLRKEGIDKAYQHGFRWDLEQDYKVMLQMDADLSHNPNALPIFLDKIKYYDAVFGSRYLRGVRVFNWPFRRLLLSKVSNKFISRMLGLKISTDTTTNYKMLQTRSYRIDRD